VNNYSNYVNFKESNCKFFDHRPIKKYIDKKTLITHFIKRFVDTDK